MAVVKPHVAAMRALTGGPQEQIAFLLMFDPMALQDVFYYGEPNVYVQRRKLRAAVNASWAKIQQQQAKREQKRD